MKAVWQTLTTYRILSWTFIAIALLSGSAWAAGLFAPGLHYDNIAHFLLPAVGAVLLYLILIEAGWLRPVASLAGTVMTIILTGTFIGAIWEVYEFILEISFDGNTQYGNTDTMIDIIMALIGSILSGVLYVKYGRRN